MNDFVYVAHIDKMVKNNVQIDKNVSISIVLIEEKLFIHLAFNKRYS